MVAVGGGKGCSDCSWHILTLDQSGGPREVGVAEMDPAGWGRRQRLVRRNCINVIPDLLDDLAR